MTRVSQSILNNLVQQIVDQAHPLQIILFGSAARGEMRQGSDIDLLVIMPDGTHRRRAAQALYRAIKNIRTPFDLIVTTPSDLHKNQGNSGLIYQSILSDGKPIYSSP